MACARFSASPAWSGRWPRCAGPRNQLVTAVTPRRLEAFSDGVFAIAATLLILNVAVTGLKPLDRELIDIWPSYAAYAIAFLTIGVVWANHHTVIDQCKHVNRLFRTLNGVSPILVASFPFPTRRRPATTTPSGA